MSCSCRSPRKGQSGNNCTTLAADASRLAALFVAYILPVCALLTPCQPGASTPRMAHLFPDGPLAPIMAAAGGLSSAAVIACKGERRGDRMCRVIIGMFEIVIEP